MGLRRSEDPQLRSRAGSGEAEVPQGLGNVRKLGRGSSFGVSLHLTLQSGCLLSCILGLNWEVSASHDRPIPHIARQCSLAAHVIAVLDLDRPPKYLANDRMSDISFLERLCPEIIEYESIRAR